MLLCGIDEAGRGPLAGPVAAAAVVLGERFPVGLLRDSKRLSAARRARLVPQIKAGALAWGIGWASPREIDRLNILRASHLAMSRAVAQLTVRPDDTVVDGSVLPELDVAARALVKADATIPAVMAASILAKEARDCWMVSYSRIDARYEFDRHKGYPTRRHRELLQLYGPSAIHRLSFAPCRDHARAAPDAR